jgi:Tfp pilus assembly protein PilF
VTGNPGFAPGYRVLGYAYLNTGKQSQALNAYRKAVDIDPNYGEAHYALAFMYAMGDLAAGTEHFRKAMDLGIPDERDLGSRFYPAGH